MKFGTSGLRGLSTELMGPTSYQYADAFGRYLLESGRARKGEGILLGRDFRESSPVIAANCSRALVALGFKVLDCGAVPTPALALYGLQTGSAALMVTGSHIPADRNGIKFYRPDGEIDKEDELSISRLAASPGNSPITEDNPMSIEFRDECAALFLARNKMLLPPGALAGLKVGIYQHSTVARDMLMEVLAHYGAQVLPLGRSDTFVPVDTEAVSRETAEKLKAWTVEHHLDAVVSADGDGDRPLVADETGAAVRGDLLGLIAARFLNASVVVTPVTSNSGIDTTGDYEVVRTRVGSPYVIAGMAEVIAAGKEGVLGFEANGGVLTGSDFTINGKLLKALPTRDCFLPMLAVLALARQERKPLSEVTRSFALPAAASDRLENFPTEASAALMAHLLKSRDNLSHFLEPIGEVAGTNEVDGLRVTLNDGRIIHFRPSGNAPEMRCYAEAKDEAAAGELLCAGLRRLREWSLSYPTR